MKIQISIRKAGNGFDFHNANAWDFPLIATIREGKNKPDIYLWRILDEGKSGFHNLAGAIGRVKANLTLIAADDLEATLNLSKNNPPKFPFTPPDGKLYLRREKGRQKRNKQVKTI